MKSRDLNVAFRINEENLKRISVKNVALMWLKSLINTCELFIRKCGDDDIKW